MRKIKRYRSKKIVALATLLLLLISLGYAALSTTLTINGTASISKTSWLVYFTNVVLSAENDVAEEVTPPTTTGKTTVALNWEVSMDTPGQKYEFTVDVVNEGTIDAMIDTAAEDMLTEGLTTAQKRYLDYSILYENGAEVERYDKLAAGETKTLKIRLEFKKDIEVSDLPSSDVVIPLTYSINYVQADDNAVTKVTSLLKVGDTVNYSTELNGVTLDNWKVFYVDGDYTYIILDDYLPNSAIDTNQTYFNKLSKNGDYSIYVNRSGSETVAEDLENRTYLINALSTKSNWDSLLTGTINGKSVNETRSEHVFAMGAPDIELWKNSWNATYAEDTLYTKYANDLVQSSTTYDGWYIGASENPSTYYISISRKEGYNNTLYYPHKNTIGSENCYGYWLTSPSAGYYSGVMLVYCRGYVGYYGYLYSNPYMAARPLVSLPSTIINQ